MDFSEDEIRDAERTAGVLSKKLLEIMDLQADIDTLLRGDQPTPFGTDKWKNARPEVLQRLVAMTAIQFILFEPDNWVEGSDKLKPIADDLLNLISDQLGWLKKKFSPE